MLAKVKRNYFWIFSLQYTALQQNAKKACRFFPIKLYYLRVIIFLRIMKTFCLQFIYFDFNARTLFLNL